MSRTPVVATTGSELAAALAELRASSAPLVLVPTMGALHEGHRALLRHAASGGRTVVVSIFVNPLQFGSAEDLARYPRDLAADLGLCADEGVALVWAPSVDDMYPGGPPAVTVDAGDLGRVLEGRSRPGHFDGVLTVVAKLFGQVRPDVAVFGAKDAQQLVLVRRMAVDLELGVVVEAVDTVRAADGLALSSRNGRLTPAGRRAATALSRSLRALAASSGRGAAAATAAGRDVLDAEPSVVLDYLALVEPDTFAEVGATHRGPVLAVVAAEVEGTRLVDALLVTIGPQEELVVDVPAAAR